MTFTAYFNLAKCISKKNVICSLEASISESVLWHLVL